MRFASIVRLPTNHKVDTGAFYNQALADYYRGRIEKSVTVSGGCSLCAARFPCWTVNGICLPSIKTSAVSLPTSPPMLPPGIKQTPSNSSAPRRKQKRRARRIFTI